MNDKDQFYKQFCIKQFKLQGIHDNPLVRISSIRKGNKDFTIVTGKGRDREGLFLPISYLEKLQIAISKTLEVYKYNKLDSDIDVCLLNIDNTHNFNDEDNSITESPKTDTGSVKTYLMHDENTGYIKIGKSKNPKFREKTLQSEKPTISMIATKEDDIEKELHDRYKDYRVRGEWFDLSETQIQEIIQLGFELNNEI